MNEQAVRAAVSEFLKKISASAQREIEKSIRQAISSGQLKGHETFTTGVTLTSDKIGLNVTLYNSIEL